MPESCGYDWNNPDLLKMRKKALQESEALTIGGWDANGSFVPAATIVETVADSTGFSSGGDGSGFGGGGASGEY